MRKIRKSLPLILVMAVFTCIALASTSSRESVKDFNDGFRDGYNAGYNLFNHTETPNVDSLEIQQAPDLAINK